MKKNRISKNRGFTMIEVSLVLAVAGAIIVMVFIAVPVVQRQARDATRRDDVLEVVSAIKSYQQNNRGALPAEDDSTGLKKYMKESDFKDPDGSNYDLKIKKCIVEADGDTCNTITTEDEVHTMFVYLGAKCGDDNQAKMNSNPRNAAVIYKLEVGGNYCSNT